MQKYLILYEQEGEAFGAYLPDLPGCVATSDNLDDLKRRIRRALTAHLLAMRQDGDGIPPPTVIACEFLAPSELGIEE